MWVPVRNGHANYECNSFMTSDGKFGQDITCAKLEKITGPMLARLKKLQAALERISKHHKIILGEHMDQVRQIAREALDHGKM